MAKGDSRIVQLIIGAKDETSKAFSNVTKGFSSLGKLAAGVAASIGTAFATVFSVRTFKGAIDSAADFEQALAKIQAVTRATPAEFNALKAAAEEMGARTKFTATQAAEALEVLARTGLSARDSITALPTVLQLATAEGLELAESATVITNTISQFGLAIEDAARVADVLVATSQKSNTNVQQLGEAFKFAGTVAANFGLSVEQTAGFLGVLANAGIRAEQAGTGLRSIILSLAKDGSTLDRELDNLGITSRDLGDVIDGLAEAGTGADKALQGFEQTSQPQIRTLVAYADAAKQLGLDLEDVQGATEAAAKTTGATFTGAVARLQSAWDALRRTLVEPLLGPIAREFDELATRIGDFVSGGRLDSFRKALLDAFNGAAEAVRRFLTEVNPQVLLDKLGSIVTGVTSFVTSIVTSFGTIERVAQGTVAAITAVFSGLQTFVGGVVSLITLPLRAIGTAIETAVGALGALGLISDETRNKVDNMARVLVDLNDNAITETANAAGRTGDALGDLKDAITGTVEPARQAGEQIGTVATEAEKIPTPVEAARQALADLVAQGAEVKQIEDAQKALNIALLEGAEKALQAEDAYNRAKDRLAELTEKGADVDELAKATDRVSSAQQRFAEALTQTSDEALKVARDLREAREAAEEQIAQIERTKEAADALGLSYNQAANEITGAVDKSVQQLKTLADAGIFTSGQIRGAFSKALDTAESRADVELLKETLQSLAEQGAISGADLTAALQGVKDKLTEVNETAATAIGGIIASFDGSAESMNAVADQLEALTAKHREHAEVAKGGQAEVKQALDETGESSQILIGDLEGAIPLWDAMSGKARQAIIDTGLFLGGVTKEAATASEGLQNLIDRFETLGQGSARYYSAGETAFGAYVEQLRQVQRQLAEAEGIQQSLNDRLADGSLRMADLERWTGQVNNQMGFLGDETLAPLRAALESARQELARMEQQTEDARLSLASLDAQIAEAKGLDERAEKLRLEADLTRDLTELQRQRDEAERAGNSELVALIDQQIRKRKELFRLQKDNLADTKKAHEDERDHTDKINRGLDKQIGQRREIVYLEEQVASRADTTAKALDRQAAAGESAQRAIQSLGSADIGQLQRSIDALVQALQDGIGRGAQQARADIQALDGLDLRNLRGELAGLTEALTTDIADGVRSALGEMSKLNSSLLSDLRSAMSALGRDLTDAISAAQRQATSQANVNRAVQQANLTPNVSIQPGSLAADTTAATQKLGEIRRAIQAIADPANLANLGNMDRFISQTIERAENLFRLLEDGSQVSFDALGQSFQFTAGEADSFSAFVKQIYQALADAKKTNLSGGLVARARESLPSTTPTPTANEIGTAVAGALAGAPLVIQIDGQALTGAIVQQLTRAAGQAN